MSPDSRQEMRKIDLARSVNDDQVPETGIEPESRMSMYLHAWRRLAASISVVVGLSAGLLASPANADTRSDNPPWAPVPASYYANGCSVPGPNVLLDQQVFPDPSPWWFFPVYFRMACDLHDAGYDGGIVFDPIFGGIVDTRGISRADIDWRFFSDLITMCNRQIPWYAVVAMTSCHTIAGTYYAAVRVAGVSRFDADPALPGVQRSGTRLNN